MKFSQLLPSISGVAALSFGVFVGCQGPGNVSKIEETLAQISEKQDTILSRMDAVEAAAKAGGGKQQRPQQKRPDPKTVYKVSVKDAHFKGPEVAKITIAEYSDFQ